MPSTTDEALVAHCREAMRRGSLSFFLAARLLRPQLRDGVLLLYAWCRHCDDAIDQADAALGRGERLAALTKLRLLTTAALAGPGAVAVDRSDAAAGCSQGAENAFESEVFAALALLARRHHIPAYYPQELLAGMEMDITGYEYRTFADLRLYCYRVASTVGLMFSHLAGVSDVRALRHAADLGTAMQLTNIARDVLTDAAMGRVYLPRDWLRGAGIDGGVDHPQVRGQVAAVVARLLDEADRCYRSGEEGLCYLPLSAAFAAAAARFIYADIGRMVRERGAAAWDERCIVPLRRKLWAVTRGLAAVMKTLPRRVQAPWQPVTIQTLWRFQ